MYKSIPSVVWVMLLGLVGIELLVLISIVRELFTHPLPMGELAILGLLFIIIGLIIWGAAWLVISHTKRHAAPPNDSTDTDFPAKTGLPPTRKL